MRCKRNGITVEHFMPRYKDQPGIIDYKPVEGSNNIPRILFGRSMEQKEVFKGIVKKKVEGQALTNAEKDALNGIGKDDLQDIAGEIKKDEGGGLDKTAGDKIDVLINKETSDADIDNFLDDSPQSSSAKESIEQPGPDYEPLVPDKEQLGAGGEDLPNEADSVTEQPADTEEPADTSTEEPADTSTEEPADMSTQEPDNAADEDSQASTIFNDIAPEGKITGGDLKVAWKKLNLLVSINHLHDFWYHRHNGDRS